MDDQIPLIIELPFRDKSPRNDMFDRVVLNRELGVAVDARPVVESNRLGGWKASYSTVGHPVDCSTSPKTSELPVAIRNSMVVQGTTLTRGSGKTWYTDHALLPSLDRSARPRP